MMIMLVRRKKVSSGAARLMSLIPLTRSLDIQCSINASMLVMAQHSIMSSLLEADATFSSNLVASQSYSAGISLKLNQGDRAHEQCK